MYTILYDLGSKQKDYEKIPWQYEKSSKMRLLWDGLL